MAKLKQVYTHRQIKKQLLDHPGTLLFCKYPEGGGGLRIRKFQRAASHIGAEPHWVCKYLSYGDWSTSCFNPGNSDNGAPLDEVYQAMVGYDGKKNFQVTAMIQGVHKIAPWKPKKKKTAARRKK